MERRRRLDAEGTAGEAATAGEAGGSGAGENEAGGDGVGDDRPGVDDEADVADIRMFSLRREGFPPITEGCLEQVERFGPGVRPGCGCDSAGQQPLSPDYRCSQETVTEQQQEAPQDASPTLR